MADRIPTYIDQATQRISEVAVDDTIDVAGVKVTNLTIDGTPYEPYDDSEVLARLANKLDADKIWTGTQDEYDLLTPNDDTLYFIV